MDILGSQSEATRRSVPKRWTPRHLIGGILILTGIVLACLVSYFSMQHSNATKEKPEAAALKAPVSAAELVSATGMVLVRKPGRIEWQEVGTGQLLMEGDLIQTDNLGDATVRYSNGTIVSVQAKTILTIQTAGNDQMEISAPPLEAALRDTPSGSSDGSRQAAPSEATAGELRPSIELQRIIPFGRSLELIGHVEAGSSLVVNDEAVEVAGDGSFKHFTDPFPAYAGKVSLFMKVTDLSGRTRTLTATYDFKPRVKDN